MQALKAFERGKQARAAGNLQQALAELQAAAAHSPHPRILAALGDTHWHAGQPAQARRAWARARQRFEAAGQHLRMGTPGRPVSWPPYIVWDGDAVVAAGGPWLQRSAMVGSQWRHQWSLSSPHLGPLRTTPTPGVLATRGGTATQAWDAVFGTNLVTFRAQDRNDKPAEWAVLDYVHRLVRPGVHGLLFEQPSDPAHSHEGVFPSPDGRYLAIQDFEQLRIVAVARNQVVRTIGSRDHPVRRFTFAPARAYVAVAIDGELRFETIAEGKPLVTVKAPRRLARRRSHPQRRRLGSLRGVGPPHPIGGEYRTSPSPPRAHQAPRQIDLQPQRWNGAHPGPDHRARRRRDRPGHRDACGHRPHRPLLLQRRQLEARGDRPADRKLHAFRLPDGTRLRELSLGTPKLRPIGFVDRSTVAAATESEVVLWDTATGQVTSRFDVGEVRTAQASPLGGHVATARTHAVAVWDARRGAKLAELPFGVVKTVALAVGCSTLALASTKTLRLLDRRSGTWRPLPMARIAALAVSAAGDRVAVATEAGVYLVAVPAGTARPVSKLGGVQALGFRRDGELLALGSRTGELHILDTASGTAGAPIAAHRQAITGVAFGPSGSLATSSKDQSVRLWALPSGQNTRTLTVTGPKDEMLNVPFSPDGKVLAAGCGLNLVLWDASSGALLRNVSLNGRAYTIAFSQDGRSVRVGSATHVFDVPIDDRPLRIVHTQAGDWHIAGNGEVIVARDKQGEVVILDPSRASTNHINWLAPKIVAQAPAELARLWLAPSDGRARQDPGRRRRR